MDLLTEIARERNAIADQIRDLDAASAAKPSLCMPWTVHQVAAHLASPFLASKRGTLLGLAKHKSLSRNINAIAADLASRHTPAHLAKVISDNATERYMAKKFDLVVYTDVVVHGNDIRRPLGMRHPIDPDNLAECLRFITNKGFFQRFFSPEPRREGLRFEATDTNWSDGSGPLVRGRAVELLIVMCGRRKPARRLEGDGVEKLVGRLPNAAG